MRKFAKRFVMLAVLTSISFANSGCGLPIIPLMGGTLIEGLVHDAFILSDFWGNTPIIPVSSYFSQEIEDTYHEEERYGKVPILDPVEGEHAPLFCLDPPSPDEVIRAVPNDAKGGLAFIAETQRNNVRMVVEPIVDKVGECRFYPMVGPARLHKCHYKCTVYFEKTIISTWPVPFSHTDNTQEVVYIDHDHLIRCAGPPSN